jgi:hypothetical protein
MPSARKCRKCGANLLPGEPEPAAAEPEPEPEPIVDPFYGVVLEEAPPPVKPDLTLVMISSGERIPLQGKDEYIVGRADAEHGIFVDVDMSEHKGWESGVSRRHARIFKKQSRFFIEDLHSANGTYLNETRIEPGCPCVLSVGDGIKFGILRLYVEM